MGNQVDPAFFQPNEGRIAVGSDEMLQLADRGWKFSLPCMVEPDADFYPSNSNTNPNTGSADHLSLFDWFHENNCKKPTEVLRRSSLLREISGMIDTQAVEQLFSSSKKDIYFLNNMLPTNHLFLFRLIYHLRNEKKNSQFYSKHLKMFGNLQRNQYGQLSQTSLEETNHDDGQPTDDFEIVEECVEEVIIEDTDSADQRQHYPAAQGNQTNSPTATCNQSQIDVLPEADHHWPQIHGQQLAQEWDFFLQMMEAVRRDINILTDVERDSLNRNDRYAREILFNEVDEVRRLQVKNIATRYGIFQSQGSTNYCGLCAVNNAIGMPTLSSFPIGITEMDNVADRLWLRMATDPHHGLLVPVEAMRDKEGFYSVEVLRMALDEKGYEMIQLNPAAISGLSDENTGEMIIRQLKEEFGMCNLIIRLSGHFHWINVRASEDYILLNDSSKACVRLISSKELGTLIARNSAAPGAVYFVFKAADATIPVSRQLDSPVSFIESHEGNDINEADGQESKTYERNDSDEYHEGNDINEADGQESKTYEGNDSDEYHEGNDINEADGQESKTYEGNDSDEYHEGNDINEADGQESKTYEGNDSDEYHEGNDINEADGQESKTYERNDSDEYHEGNDINEADGQESRTYERNDSDEYHEGNDINEADGQESKTYEGNDSDESEAPCIGKEQDEAEVPAASCRQYNFRKRIGKVNTYKTSVSTWYMCTMYPSYMNKHIITPSQKSH